MPEVSGSNSKEELCPSLGQQHGKQCHSYKEQYEQPNNSASEFPSVVFQAVHRPNYNMQRCEKDYHNRMAVRKTTESVIDPEKPGTWQ